MNLAERAVKRVLQDIEDYKGTFDICTGKPLGIQAFDKLEWEKFKERAMGLEKTED